MNSVLRKESLNDLAEAGVVPTFALSCLGRNQRGLKEKYAALYEPYFRDQPPPTGSGNRDRPRIGILVSRRHEGLFTRCAGGLFARLNRERFELVILASQASIAPLQKLLPHDGLRYVAYRDALPDAIRQIRDAACDLIYYWEVGSDPLSKMGVEDLVVHSPGEYVGKAVQVATDRDYRKYVTERIAGASDVLYNDLLAVREHERFFAEALNHGK